jgi:hypothetical protein
MVLFFYYTKTKIMNPNTLPEVPAEQHTAAVQPAEENAVIEPVPAGSVDDMPPNVQSQSEEEHRLPGNGAVRMAAGWVALRLQRGGANESVDYSLDVDEQAVVDTLERQHFVREAPRFTSLVGDTTRTNYFTSYVDTHSTRQREYDGTMDRDAPKRTLTEHEGLAETYGFLTQAAELPHTEGTSPELEAASSKARTILQELHFIGERELDEATKGIAALWKSKLLADPSQKLCVPDVIGDTETMSKSGGYLFQRVLSQFSDEERSMFGPRILTDLKQLRGKPEKTTVILLDDWSISSTQLSTGFGDIISDRRSTKWSGQVEVHLVAASTTQLDNAKVQGRPVPTFAYYKCEQDKSNHEGSPVITGIHSSVDFGFEKQIEDITKALNERPDHTKTMMPPMTNIVRPYRTN